jgi:HTH-type transcriptional regulator/antitoxin HigA
MLTTPVAAVQPGMSAFERTWSRTDLPVAETQVNRTWMWGPVVGAGLDQKRRPFLGRSREGGVDDRFEPAPAGSVVGHGDCGEILCHSSLACQRPRPHEADHRAAFEEIERLMDAKPGTPAGDRLEVLATLVDHYESQHEPIEPPDHIDALRYHVESRGLTRRDLEPFLGSRARVAEVLNRRRPLTIEMIRKLHQGLGISADVLIRPYRIRRSAA